MRLGLQWLGEKKGHSLETYSDAFQPKLHLEARGGVGGDFKNLPMPGSHPLTFI